MTKKPPPVSKRPYNHKLNGVYGEFGTGANAQIYFLQTAIEPGELRKIALISDISGSERWSVRDLFQREVDTERVTTSVLPYLRDSERVKFFNPLTLTVLPLDEATQHPVSAMPGVKELRDYEEDGYKWNGLELPGVFRFRHAEGAEEYGVMEWNESRVKIVAIDGQHRLSALKRLYSDPGPKRGEFMKWSIPVVVCGIRQIDKRKPVGSVLDVIRSIFIYINTAAQRPNECRQILLSDESVTRICTQEVVEYSHDNDTREHADRDPDRLPLLFFDWRGVEKAGRRERSPAYVKEVEEIHDWLEWYVLGEDWSPEQEVALGVQPTDSLKSAFVNNKLSTGQVKELRARFRKTVLLGLSLFLQEFTPYKKYIQELRKIEREFNTRSDVARHAFYKLRFGDHQGEDHLREDIEITYDKIVEKLLDIKGFPPLIAHDIGMRGIVCGFGLCKSAFEEHAGASVEWRDYAKWFVSVANKMCDEGWFVGADGTPKKARDLLIHVSYDHAGNICNYRLEHAQQALGAVIKLRALFDLRSRKKGGKLTATDWDDRIEECLDALQSTIKAGYKKEVRPRLREKHPEGGRKLTRAVNEEAEKLSLKHKARLKKHFEAL